MNVLIITATREGISPRSLRLLRALSMTGHYTVTAYDASSGHWIDAGGLPDDDSGDRHVPTLTMSNTLWRKATLEKAIQDLSETKADVVLTVDDVSLQIGSNLQAAYWRDAHRCLWFHDLENLETEKREAFDNFHSRRTVKLGEWLRQTDRVITRSDAYADQAHADYVLAVRPLVIKNTPFSDEIPPASLVTGRGGVAEKRIRLLGGMPSERDLLALSKTVSAGMQIVIEADSQEIGEAIARRISNAPGRKARVSLDVHAPCAGAILAPNADLAAVLPEAAHWLSQKGVLFIPASVDVSASGIASDDPRVITLSNELSATKSRSFIRDSLLKTRKLRKRAPKLASAGDIGVRLHAAISEISWRLEDRPPLPRDAELSDVRVLHGLTGAAGLPWMLSRAQRDSGMKSDTFCADGAKFAYRSDKSVLDIDFTAISSFIKTHASKYDVFQFYFRSYYFNKITLSYPTAIDLLALKAAGKRIVFFFMGSEIRFHSKYKEFSRFNYVDERPGNVANFPEETQRRLFSIFTSIADVWAVSDAEMESYVPGTPIVERAIDLDSWPVVKPPKNPRPRVVHAPSRQAVKGSQYVFEAVDKLREEGLDFDFTLVENLPQSEARKVYAEADIVIDQLRIGWYGFLSVEAMAMGKPVICYIRDDLLEDFGREGPPVAVADPETITDVLRNLIQDQNLREAMGHRGRQFVERVHAKEVVSKKFDQLYRQAIANPRPVDIPKVAEFLMHQTQYMNKELARLRAKAGR